MGYSLLKTLEVLNFLGPLITFLIPGTVDFVVEERLLALVHVAVI